MLLAASGVILVLTGILAFGSGAGPVELLLFALLSIGTMWRFYADVEFRLRLNYKRYFIYYAIISAGYATGAAVFHVTGRWEVSLLLRNILSGEAVTIFCHASLPGKTIAMVSTPQSSVIIGYPARYKCRLTPKAMHLISATAAAVIIVGTLG